MATSSSIIRGVEVSFPYAPYEVQRVLMERAIAAMQTSSNALLESPTGTGKSLSLLCASLAWQKHHLQQQQPATTDQPKPLIIYASRTHLQLEQVNRELKKTAHAKNTRAITVGSRDSAVCVHAKVGKLKPGAEQTAACRQLVSMKQCAHRHAAQAMAAHTPLPDIEDLAIASASDAATKCCAYYFPRDALAVNAQAVDVLFMPYNYLVDQAARRGLAVPWPNSVIIIDEAHNIGEVCEDAYSFSLAKQQLVGAADELGQLITQFIKHPPHHHQQASSAMSVMELTRTKAVLVQLEREIAKCGSSCSTATTSTSHAVLGPFAAARIDFATVGALLARLDMCIDALTQSHLVSHHLDHVVKCLTKLFDVQPLQQQQDESSSSAASPVADSAAARQTANLDAHYRCVVEQQHQQQGGGGGWVLNLWCFAPGLAFQDLKRMGVRSILVASGTLAPLDPFAAALRVPFPIRLESPHVVSKDRVFLGCLSTGVTGGKLNGSYQHRNDAGYVSELGNTLVALARVIPDGVLVFFPSYPVMQTCIAQWKQHNQGEVWSRLSKTKEALVVEQRGGGGGGGGEGGSSEEYDAALSTGGGAMMFAVCRGRASEGMDFRDKRARGVIMVGLPFPNSQDSRVQHKRAFLDQQQKQHTTSSQTGSQWYTQQAHRAVGQAIGRAIRHELDYGAILLLDERFAGYTSNLSMWLRPCFQHFDQGPRQAIPQLVGFFKRFKMMATTTVTTEPPPAAAPSTPKPTTTASSRPPSAVKAPRLDLKPSAVAAAAPINNGGGQGAGEFCNDCRALFSPAQYQEFKRLLRDYSAGTHGPVATSNAERMAGVLAALNRRAVALFAQLQEPRSRKLALLARLCGFLPSNARCSLHSHVQVASAAWRD